jgi:Flp pilus assembly protein TadD
MAEHRLRTKPCSQTIRQYFVTAGEPPVTGKDFEAVTEAMGQLEQVVAEAPEQWSVHWFLGKGHLALGNDVQAHQAFRRAYELEKNIEVIPRELAGVCLQLGEFKEAVDVAEQSVSIQPDNADLIGNLALAYLLAGRLEESLKSIATAVKLAPEDKINQRLSQIIAEVVEGKRPQPTTLTSLTSRPPS